MNSLKKWNYKIFEHEIDLFGQIFNELDGYQKQEYLEKVKDLKSSLKEQNKKILDQKLNLTNLYLKINQKNPYVNTIQLRIFQGSTKNFIGITERLSRIR